MLLILCLACLQHRLVDSWDWPKVSQDLGDLRKYQEEFKRVYELNYESFKSIIKGGRSKLKKWSDISISSLGAQTALHSLSYVDVPVAWLHSIGKIFSGNISDFVFVYQISHPISLSVLVRVAKSYDMVCRLGYCNKFHLLYNSMKLGLETRKNDESMLRGILPDANLFVVEPEEVMQIFSKKNFTEAVKSNVARSRGDSFSQYALSIWFVKNHGRLGSSFAWVVQDDVGWVGEFGQVLSMLQVSSRADYLATGCVAPSDDETVIDAPDDETVVYQSQDHDVYYCHAEFVRYSAQLLESLHNALLSGEQFDSNSFAISHVVNHSFKYLDLADLTGQVFESPLWNKSLHYFSNGNDNSSDTVHHNSSFDAGLSKHEFERFEQEYALKSAAIIIYPTRPVALIFRNLLDH